MRVAVVGSGGVGGLFGGRLLAAGVDVTFIARGAHLAAIREHGLRIESDALGPIDLPAAQATDDPASIGPVDVVILSVKLWDTEAVARAIAPLVAGHTGILSLQNGVVKDDVLRAAWGEEAVMGGVAYVASHIERPGVIRHGGTMQRVVLGEYDGARSARAEALRDAWVQAGVAAELSTDVRRAIWEKYVFLVGLSGATSTMRVPIGPIREHAQSRAFLLDLMRETTAVARAHGVELPPDYADDRLTFVDGLPAGMTSSMHRDLEAGRRLEVRWLSGGVVHLGAAAGVPTPANRAVCDILALHESGSPAHASS